MSDEGGGAGVVQGHRWLLGSDSGGSGNLEKAAFATTNAVVPTAAKAEECN